MAQTLAPTSPTQYARDSGRPIPRGWWFVLAMLAAALLTCAVLLAVHGTSRDGILWCVRATPRPAVIFFVAAFLATPLYRLRPGPATGWLVQQRRYLGLSFAVWHLVHLAGLIALAAPDVRAFWNEMALLTITVGGGCFVLIILMTATSFDRTAALVGPRAWKIIHTAGLYLTWLIFIDTYRGRIESRDQWFDVFACALVAVAMLVRIAAAVRHRRQRCTAAAPTPA